MQIMACCGDVEPGIVPDRVVTSLLIFLTLWCFLRFGTQLTFTGFVSLPCPFIVALKCLPGLEEIQGNQIFGQICFVLSGSLRARKGSVVGGHCVLDLLDIHRGSGQSRDGDHVAQEWGVTWINTRVNRIKFRIETTESNSGLNSLRMLLVSWIKPQIQTLITVIDGSIKSWIAWMADLAVCSLMDFGIWTFLFYIVDISKLFKSSCSLCFYFLRAAACWLFFCSVMSVWISGLI